MSELSELGKRYLWNDEMLKPILAGFESEDWQQQPGAGNSALWLVGHLTYARRMVLRILGEEIPTADWEACVGLGSSGKLDLAKIPSPQDLLEEFNALGKQLAQKLSDMSEEEAQTALEKPMPFGVKTRKDVAHFFYMHDTYHVGQLGLIRRFLNKSNEMA